MGSCKMDEFVAEAVEAEVFPEHEKHFLGKVAVDHNKQLVIIKDGQQEHTGEIISMSQQTKGGETLVTVDCKHLVQKKKGKQVEKYKLRFTRSKSLQLNTFLHAYSLRTKSWDLPASDSVKREIKMWATTWNMANNKTTVREYYEWVKKVVRRLKPDLILFGVQESEDPNMCNTLDAELPDYEVVYKRWDSSTDEWGWIKMAVFAEKSLKPYISNIHQAEKSTGLLRGLVKNKGAIAVSMKVYASPICFIVSHLAAHQDKVDVRNQNFSDIVEHTSFRGLSEKEDSILTSHHHVVWAGDLNYRIALPRPEVCARIERKDYAYLFKYDQLHTCMQNNTTFNGFTEGKKPEFPPTYRYYRKEGTNLALYNPEKERIPAWCDRVLVRSFPTLKATCEEYNRCYSLLPSDHRPVYALWKLEVTIPPAQPPLFASVIGVRPRIKFGHISVYGIERRRVKLTIRADFLGTNSVSTAPVSKGRDKAKFMEDDIPQLTPDMWTTVEHIKTQFIRVFVYDGGQDVDNIFGVAIIPVEYAHVDIMRKESTEILHHHKVVGRISYSYMLSLVSEMRLTGRVSTSTSVRFGTKPVTVML